MFVFQHCCFPPTTSSLLSNVSCTSLLWTGFLVETTVNHTYTMWDSLAACSFLQRHVWQNDNGRAAAVLPLQWLLLLPPFTTSTTTIYFYCFFLFFYYYYHYYYYCYYIFDNLVSAKRESRTPISTFLGSLIQNIHRINVTMITPPRDLHLLNAFHKDILMIKPFAMKRVKGVLASEVEWSWLQKSGDWCVALIHFLYSMSNNRLFWASTLYICR